MHGSAGAGLRKPEWRLEVTRGQATGGQWLLALARWGEREELGLTVAAYQGHRRARHTLPHCSASQPSDDEL